MSASGDATLERAFVGWQCRVRQHAVRRGDGRPTSGMRPRAALADGRVMGPFTTVLVPSAAAEAAAQFRHLHRTQRSPRERYEAIMRVLQASWYQQPEDFSDMLAAVFAPHSAPACALLEAGSCRLAFEQFGQAWAFDCGVAGLAAGDDAFDATWWHNALFNPALDTRVMVLSFAPDWQSAVASPPLTR